MPKQEVYKSTTHGPIKLSFTGRRLLANERDAAQKAIAAGDFNTDDRGLSKARGDLAQYMSGLEQKDGPDVNIHYTFIDEGEETARRLDGAMKDIAGQQREIANLREKLQASKSRVGQLERRMFEDAGRLAACAETIRTLTQDNKRVTHERDVYANNYLALRARFML